MNLSYTIPKAEENIIAGIKKHTLRTDRGNRWRPGMTIHHSYSFRSKSGYRCFKRDICKSVQQVLIIITRGKDGSEHVVISIDRKQLSPTTVLKFIINDGFGSIDEFINWFFKINRKSGRRLNTMWAGKIIHWTDLKY